MSELVNMGMKSEFSDGSQPVNLMGNPNPQTQRAARKAVESNTVPSLTEEQKKLLDEIQKRPEVIRLLGAIFKDYPAAIRDEILKTQPHKTNRQKKAGMDAAIRRLQIEAWIEKEIAALAGIGIPETEQVQEIEDSIDETAEELKEVAEKATATKKTTKKKSSRKKAPKTDIIPKEEAEG
jgi:hypothetical protein